MCSPKKTCREENYAKINKSIAPNKRTGRKVCRIVLNL